jgi:hypothetical protein
MNGITGRIDVKDNKSTHVTVNFDERSGFEDGTHDWGGGVKDKFNLHIGGTKAIGDGELNDLIGGQFNINKHTNDLETLLNAVLTGDGVSGVEVVSLTCGEVTLAFDNGRAVDTMTLTGEYVRTVLEAIDSPADLGDGHGRFSVVDGDRDVIGTGVINDLVGGQFNGVEDVQAVLQAALDLDDDRVELVSLGEDSFSVRVINEGRGTVDTLLFKGDNAAGALDGLSGGFINTGNTGDEFVFIQAGDTGVFGNPRGIDGANAGGANDMGGQLNINAFENDIEFLLAQEAANDIPDVTVTEVADVAIIEIDGRDGSVDTIVYELA